MSGVDNRKYRSFTAEVGVRVATFLSWASGLFALALFTSLMLNHINVERNTPLADPALKSIKQAIEKNPQDQQLKKSARALSFMSRKAYFTNQDEMKSAGWLLFGSLIVFLASMKTRTELTLRLPVPQGLQPMEGGRAERATFRWAVGAGAGLMVALTLFVVYISPPEMELKLQESAATPPKEAAPAAGVKPPDVPPPAADLKLPANAWPAFRGPDAAGVAHHKSAPLKWNGKSGEHILWKSPIAREGTGSVVTWENRVFISSGDATAREMYCYDAADGKLLWTGSAEGIPGSPSAGLKVFDGTSWAPATPAVDGARVYAVFVTGDIAAWTFDGKRAWARNLGVPKNSYGHASSLVVHAGRVLVQMDDQTGGRLLALDAKTGATVWESKREVKEAWSTPAIHHTAAGVQVVVCGLPLVSGYDALTGKHLWSVKCLGGEVAPSPALAGPLVFAASDHSMAAAIETGPEAKILWKHQDDLPDVSSPVATEKFVLMCSSGGIVTCFDAKTGKVVWTKEFDDGFYGSPILVDDRVYVMDRNGSTVVFRLGEKYEELARNELGEKADATPSIPEGRVYVRSIKTLYCIGEAKK